jgi:signal transduction histidine kinase
MTSLAEFTSCALVMIRLLEDEQQVRQKAESEVEERTSQLRRLSTRLLKSQDDERRRIARGLHDSVGQSLTSLKLNLELMKKGSTRALPDLLSECFAGSGIVFVGDAYHFPLVAPTIAR